MTNPAIESLLGAMSIRGRATKAVTAAQEKLTAANQDFEAAQQLVAEAKRAVRGVMAVGMYRLKKKLILVVEANDVRITELNEVEP